MRLLVSSCDTLSFLLPIWATRTSSATATSIEGAQLWKVTLIKRLLSRQTHQLCIGLRLSVGELSRCSLFVKVRQHRYFLLHFLHVHTAIGLLPRNGQNLLLCKECISHLHRKTIGQIQNAALAHVLCFGA